MLIGFYEDIVKDLLQVRLRLEFSKCLIVQRKDATESKYVAFSVKLGRCFLEVSVRQRLQFWN